MYKITLQDAKKMRACRSGIEKALKAYPDQTEISLRQLLDSNGIEDAVWALRCIDDKNTELLFRVDIASLVVPVYEKWYPNDFRVRNYIKAMYDFVDKKISEKDLKKKYRECRFATDTAYLDTASPAAPFSAAHIVIDVFDTTLLTFNFAFRAAQLVRSAKITCFASPFVFPDGLAILEEIRDAYIKRFC
jgi:hypothetical protein